MSGQRITAVEYIRGVAMLGVVGIHTGACTLSNPNVNLHLFALLEIVSRFSVPIFFFVSAFGLFRSHPLDKELKYGQFMLRRFRMVLIPYLTWSILYMLHYSLTYHDFYIWKPTLVYKYFLFGLASYQLYFLVILLWFYAFIPLWRWLARAIIRNPFPLLGILLLLQIVFNYYSSYYLRPSAFSNHYLAVLVEYRLSYWVVHYLFVFMLGAVCAARFADFVHFTERFRTAIYCFFVSTLAGMLLFYYYLVYGCQKGPEDAVNLAHQLSPIGVLYTIAAALFLFTLFRQTAVPKPIIPILMLLSEHSYPVYLVHPFLIYYLTQALSMSGLIMTTPVTVLFYLCIITGSLLFAIAIKHLSRTFPFISLFLSGKSIPKRLKSGQ